MLSGFTDGFESTALEQLYAAQLDGNTILSFDTTANPPTPTTFASTGLDHPYFLTFDAAGNLYASNSANNTIERFTPGGVGSVFASTGGYPEGLAFDAAGNLYVANTDSNTIQKFTPGGVGSTFATIGGPNHPGGLAIDTAGNLYVAISNGGVPATIEKFTPGGVGSVFANLGTPVTNLGGLAFDAAGNLYAAVNNNTIERYTPGGVGSDFASSELNEPYGLAFDSAGNLYVGNIGAPVGKNTIERFMPNGTGSVFATGLDSPIGLAIRASAVPKLSSFWSTRTDSGSITLSTAQHHTGTQSLECHSTATSQDKEVYIYHTFSTPTYGDVSVWVYDTGAGVLSSNYLSLRMTGIGSIFTDDYDLGVGDPSHDYQISVAGAGGYDSHVARTQAWHQFQINDDVSGLSVLVDGHVIYSGAPPAAISDIEIGNSGPWWRPSWTGYFDDFAFIPNQPNLAATSLAWNTAQGGVDFGYTISGADSPQPPSVALYWASGTTADTTIGNPIATPTATKTAQGASESFHVTPAQLGPSPPGARYLLDVVNPPGANHIPESDETNGNDPNDIAFLDTQPTLAPIAGQTVAGGKSLTLTLQGSDPNGLSLTYSARVDSLAYHLKATLGLYYPGSYYTNAFGGGEQWVQGSGGAWYYILPNGAFYRWSGSGLTGTLVAQLDPSYNANPALLLNAQPGQGQAAVGVSGTQVTITPDSGFAGPLFVTATVSNGYNTASQTFQLTVIAPPTLAAISDETVTAGKSLTLTLQGSDPAGLPLTYSARVDSLAYHLKSTLGLYSTGNYYTNYYGGGEQWVQGSGGFWYYILPSGALYRWSGSGLTGTLVAQLGPSYNANPELLVNAQPGQGQAAVDISGAQVTITPDSGFAGLLFVTATVSDGYFSTSRAFPLTVTTSNGPPTLGAIPDQVVTAGQGLTLTLQGSDPAGLPLTYSARVDSLAYHLKSTLGLSYAGSYYTNAFGGGEQWVQDSGGAWYYILPNGAFYRWSGSGLTGTLVAQLDPSYNANPALLLNAQPGQGQATVSVSGSTLTITPNAGFIGLLYVTASVTDGHGSASQTFKVTITS